MGKLYCHLCGSLDGLIILRTGHTVCPRCVYELPVAGIDMPGALRKQFKFTPVIDPRGTLDFIGAQLMANFLRNGRTVRSVARQMGITHSTVYARLRKYDLIHKTSEDKVMLNATVNDFAHAGGLDLLFSKKPAKLSADSAANLAASMKRLTELNFQPANPADINYRMRKKKSKVKSL